jgi:hypothetical protein
LCEGKLVHIASGAVILVGVDEKLVLAKVGLRLVIDSLMLHFKAFAVVKVVFVEEFVM